MGALLSSLIHLWPIILLKNSEFRKNFFFISIFSCHSLIKIKMHEKKGKRKVLLKEKSYRSIRHCLVLYLFLLIFIIYSFFHYYLHYRVITSWCIRENSININSMKIYRFGRLGRGSGGRTLMKEAVYAELGRTLM